MLNLKEAAYCPELCSTLHTSTIRFNTHRSTIHFNANVLIGNLGESLDFAVEDDEYANATEDNSEIDRQLAAEILPVRVSDYGSLDLS